MKKLILVSLLSCLAVGHADASEISSKILEGTLWAGAGFAAMAVGAILGEKTYDRFIDPYNATGNRNLVCTGLGLASWAAVFCMSEKLKHEGIVPTLGLISGLGLVFARVCYVRIQVARRILKYMVKRNKVVSNH